MQPSRWRCRSPGRSFTRTRTGDGGTFDTADAGRIAAELPQSIGNRPSVVPGHFMLGLELRDTVAIAVAVSDDGQVRARADATSASDLVSAAIEALDRVAASIGGPPAGSGAPGSPG